MNYKEQSSPDQFGLHLHFPVIKSQIPFPEQLLGHWKIFTEQSSPDQFGLHLHIPVKLSQIPFPEQLLGQMKY